MIPDLKLGDNGHVGLHKSLRARLLDVRDFSSIQAAINAGSSVYIPDGTYTIDAPIECADGVDVTLSRKAVIKPSGDFDCVHMAKMVFSGGVIDCSGVSKYTSSAVVFDGADHFRAELTILKDITIRRNYLQTGGTAIHLTAQGSQEMIVGVHVQNVHVFFFGDPLILEAYSELGNCYINGNIFRDLWIDGGEYILRILANNTEISMNVFDIINQTTPEAKNGIVMQGLAYFNRVNLTNFDYNAAGAFISLDSQTAYNRIIYAGGSPNIVDAGTNKIESMRLS